MHTRPSTASAADLKHHLDELWVERLEAAASGLDGNDLYLGDLALEIAVTEAAYVGAAVTEIASLRAALDGPLVG